jgi:phosphoglycolate phosphatase-like HAD superfamily hydrolase
MEPRTLLLFDIDGTMLTCPGRGVRAMHRAIQRIFDLPPAEARIEPRGKTDPMLFDELGDAYGLPLEILAARTAELHATYLQELEPALAEVGACACKPGVESLLVALARRTDVRLGIVSGNLEPAARLKLAAVGLDGYFAAGAFGSDGRRRADLVGLALRRFGPRPGTRFPPGAAWVIGDTPEDVAAGRAAGTRTLAVATGGFRRADLEMCSPDVVLDDFVDTDAVVRILCNGR